MTEFARIEAPMSMFSDQELAGLFAATTLWHAHGIEGLSILVACMARSEAERRHWNRQHPHEPPKEAGYGDIRLSDWSDKDVADALVFCWGFADTNNIKLGELVDALGETFVTIAGERLRASHDPRNATGFEERCREREGNRNDPEAN